MCSRGRGDGEQVGIKTPDGWKGEPPGAINKERKAESDQPNSGWQ